MAEKADSQFPCRAFPDIHPHTYPNEGESLLDNFVFLRQVLLAAQAGFEHEIILLLGS